MKVYNFDGKEIKISEIPHFEESKWLFSYPGDRHEDRQPIFIGTLQECIKESINHSDYEPNEEIYSFSLTDDYDYTSEKNPGLECHVSEIGEEDLIVYGVIEYFGTKVNKND